MMEDGLSIIYNENNNLNARTRDVHYTVATVINNVSLARKSASIRQCKALKHL